MLRVMQVCEQTIDRQRHITLFGYNVRLSMYMFMHMKMFLYMYVYMNMYIYLRSCGIEIKN